MPCELEQGKVLQLLQLDVCLGSTAKDHKQYVCMLCMSEHQQHCMTVPVLELHTGTHVNYYMAPRYMGYPEALSVSRSR